MHAGSSALTVAYAQPTCPSGNPAWPGPLAADSECRGPHLADQFPALVDAPRARVTQESGDRRAATAPPPQPGLHPAPEPGGCRAQALASGWDHRAAPLYWGPRRRGLVLLARGREEGGVQTLRGRRAAGAGRCVGGAWACGDVRLAGVPVTRAALPQGAPTQRQSGALNPLALSILRLLPTANCKCAHFTEWKTEAQRHCLILS